MPKPTRRRKDNDFIRFRPCQAFTTAAERSKDNARKKQWRIIWLVVLITLIAFAVIHNR